MVMDSAFVGVINLIG